MLGCYVSAANTADVKAAPAVLVWVLELYERITKMLADKGYQGVLAALIHTAFSSEECRVELEISQRPNGAKDFNLNRSDGLLNGLGPGWKTPEH